MLPQLSNYHQKKHVHDVISDITHIWFSPGERPHSVGFRNFMQITKQRKSSRILGRIVINIEMFSLKMENEHSSFVMAFTSSVYWIWMGSK